MREELNLRLDKIEEKQSAISEQYQSTKSTSPVANSGKSGCSAASTRSGTTKCTAMGCSLLAALIAGSLPGIEIAEDTDRAAGGTGEMSDVKQLKNRSPWPRRQHRLRPALHPFRPQCLKINLSSRSA